MFEVVTGFIKKLYPGKDFIPLHEPTFQGNEKKYLNEAIDSTFVSSVGAFVNRFEQDFANYIKVESAVVTGNGTSALHTALVLAGVTREDEVLTQALTFVATANAISYCHAHPVFLDSDKNNLGLSVESLNEFLTSKTEMREGLCFNKKSGRVIRACVPMHVFGHPVEIDKISKLCKQHNVVLIEDAAESLGSYYKGEHTGTFGDISAFSFNGNKIITSGGGGMVVTNNPKLGQRAKHITTTAKVPHKWDFYHDEVGYNYRMPNINAALACAQLERLTEFIENKRQTAMEYKSFFDSKGIEFVNEPKDAKANFWLNAILLKDRSERDLFLEECAGAGVMARPVWKLMPDLPMFKHFESMDLSNAKNIESRLVNIPSSVRTK